MAQKEIKKGIIKYICENCNEVMFEVFKDTNDLIGPENLKTYIKNLNARGRKGLYYTCQFCGINHKGYYKDDFLGIDFRPILVKSKNIL